MEATAAEFSAQVQEIGALMQATNTAIMTLIARTRTVEAAGRDAGKFVLEFAELIGRDGQAREGQLTVVLAEAERMKANRGGLAPWISTHLNVTDGKARGIAQSAREIGGLPEFAESLTSGAIGADTIRAMTRAAQAVKGTKQNFTAALTETLEISARDGVGKANRHVRILEETLDPGSAEARLEQQRRRSFARIAEIEEGMCWLEVLLDDERATAVRAAIDQEVSTVLRARQFDGTELVPADVKSVEQLQAHALTRFAEVYLNATEERRREPHTAPVVYSTSLDKSEDAGLVLTVYGTVLPRTVCAPLGDPAAHLLEHCKGQPVVVDGKFLDQNPAARLATPWQRIGLGWRDKTCTYEGCTRPVTWALHAHHDEAYDTENTIMKNLYLLCSEHHTLLHHPGV